MGNKKKEREKKENYESMKNARSFQCVKQVLSGNDIYLNVYCGKQQSELKKINKNKNRKKNTKNLAGVLLWLV